MEPLLGLHLKIKTNRYQDLTSDQNLNKLNVSADWPDFDFFKEPFWMSVKVDQHGSYFLFDRRGGRVNPIGTEWQHTFISTTEANHPPLKPLSNSQSAIGWMVGNQPVSEMDGKRKAREEKRGAEWWFDEWHSLSLSRFFLSFFDSESVVLGGTRRRGRGSLYRMAGRGWWELVER